MQDRQPYSQCTREAPTFELGNRCYYYDTCDDIRLHLGKFERLWKRNPPSFCHVYYAWKSESQYNFDSTWRPI